MATIETTPDRVDVDPGVPCLRDSDTGREGAPRLPSRAALPRDQEEAISSLRPDHLTDDSNEAAKEIPRSGSHSRLDPIGAEKSRAWLTPPH